MPCVAPCKAIQDSLIFWIPRGGFQSSMKLGFWIPIFSGIPDSLRCIPDSKAQDSGFRIPQAKISRIPESILPYMGRVTCGKQASMTFLHPSLSRLACERDLCVSCDCLQTTLTLPEKTKDSSFQT